MMVTMKQNTSPTHDLGKEKSWKNHGVLLNVKNHSIFYSILYNLNSLYNSRTFESQK